MKAQYGFFPVPALRLHQMEVVAAPVRVDIRVAGVLLLGALVVGRYREEADRMKAAAHCRVRKDSVRVVEALVTASRNLSGRSPSILLRKTVLSLKSPTGAFIVPLRFTNAKFF